MKKILIIIMSLFLFTHISFADDNENKIWNLCNEKFFNLEEKVRDYETGGNMTEEDIKKELNEWKDYCINQFDNFYTDDKLKENIKTAFLKGTYRRNLKILLINMERNKEYKKVSEENSKQYAIGLEYKEKMREKLGNKINSLPKEKLQEISNKLLIVYRSYEANVKISKVKKEKILFQIQGIITLITERIYNIDNSLDDLLQVQ